MKKNCSKRTDGRWQYSKQKEGYLYYAIAPTYRQLIDKIPNIKPKLIKSVKHKTAKTSQNTFLQYYQFYIDNYIKTKDLNENQLKDWERQLKNDITPVFKYVKLQDITSEQIQTFLAKIDKERKQEIMYQRICRVLKKAYATGKIKRDITLGIEKPQRKNIQERKPLNFHEQIALLKAVKTTNLFAFTIFSIVIGSRREETMRFDLSTDVDERKCEIHIKGTKTENADRYVKTTKAFIQFLRDNMKSNTFTFNISYPTHELGKIFKRLKIDGCLHGLRHTCAANLMFLGAKDKFRQLQLGHSSIVTTNDIYTNIKENIPKRYLRLIYEQLYPQFD